MRQPKKDHAAPKQKQSAVEYIWEERGCMQQRREPIVRCRDCKNYDESDAGCNYFALAENKLLHIKNPNGFCAWVIKK